MKVMQSTDSTIKNSFSYISDKWDEDIIPQLETYISIPNKSPMFDSNWKENGYMDDAMQLIVDWCKRQDINNMSLELLEDEGRTPLLFLEIPGTINETVLMYGHMDKQPEMTGWDADKAPWKPVLQDGKLYGRGGADDGYAIFASLTAIKVLQDNNIPHSRIVIIVEASEESGSNDLPHYLNQLNDKIGHPNLVVCLDSGCGNYEQMWSTTSLRGLIEGDLRIDVLKDGIHSGVGSGVVPSTFSILRHLLDRIEDSSTHQIILDALNVEIPEQRIDQAHQAAEALGDLILSNYTLVDDTRPVTDVLGELLLNRTWRPALSVVGTNGLPPVEEAGNVTIPTLTTKLSIRIPPGLDPDKAVLALKETLESDIPHGATVSFTPGHCGPGWNAPPVATWLEEANNKASMLFYDKPSAYIGEGGTIPFMGMLGEMYPQAQFAITGVLGPKSNAHGPNEFLHIDMVKRLTGCIASVLASHYEQFSK
jgi:acetylornithine deacetylase/succinyl-diaminopimelate desuccinylase-like protein